MMPAELVACTIVASFGAYTAPVPVEIKSSLTGNRIVNEDRRGHPLHLSVYAL